MEFKNFTSDLSLNKISDSLPYYNSRPIFFILQLEQILATWEEYATIKKWKKGLKFNSHRNRLSPKTLESIRHYMPLFIEFTRKTPDALIEEALAGKHVVKERLSDFCSWLEDVKHKKFNGAVQGSYRIIRGFYSHNDINTQKIRTPTVEPSQVQFSDDELPLFEIVETRREDGTTEKVKKLRRDLLKNFFDLLSLREKAIALGIKDSGLDIGDIVDLPLAVVKYQDPTQERLFIRDLRNKTGESVSTFFGKESTKLIRNYVNLNRKTAKDIEPTFVESIQEFKKRFARQHGRKYDPQRDEMSLEAVDPHYIAMCFRYAAEKLEKMLSTPERPVKFLYPKKQSPLRPKRFRKLFNDACDDAGIPVDIKRVFMGKKDPANKAYESKSRQDLELWYEKVEPRLMVYSDQPIAESERTKYLEESVEDLKLKFARHAIAKDEKEKKMEKRIKELEEQIKADRKKFENS